MTIVTVNESGCITQEAIDSRVCRAQYSQNDRKKVQDVTGSFHDFPAKLRCRQLDWFTASTRATGVYVPDRSIVWFFSNYTPVFR